jgi:hypothetical protein
MELQSKVSETLPPSGFMLILMISEKMTGARHVARMGEMRNAYNI